MIPKVLNWLEERTGLVSGLHHALYEDIPASAGWHQVMGSVALFSFMTQVFTGIMLAMNYAPTATEAHTSLKYILTELTGGQLMRGLHHWGASMMVIIVVLHMIQVFVWGAYKKPREATWMVGVVLLLITMVFGLTGYLLPWDNRAYWGTVVTTQIAGQAPVLGPYIQQLMGASNGVGALTFTRFYSVHVMILPLLMVLLIMLHVYLVRRHGVAPAADDNKPKKKFFPEQVFKDTVAIFIAFCILFALAIFAKVPLGRLADPTDTAYIPRPEWYFLFLFQTLKYFEGPLEIVGSLVLPNLAIVVLLLVPFIDRGPAIKTVKRTYAMVVVLLCTLGWSALTMAALRNAPTNAGDEISLEAPEPWQELAPDQLAGIGVFRKEGCVQCHAAGKQPFKTVREMDWVTDHIKEKHVGPSPENQLRILASFSRKASDDAIKNMTAAAQLPVEGAIFYQVNQCGICHEINGVGMKTGPKLNGVIVRRTREWLTGHFIDPQKYSPGTPMPAYKFSPSDMERMLAYLTSLPE